MSTAEEAKLWRINNPDKEREKHEKWRKANMEKVNAYQRKKRLENPEAERNKKYKKLYGITINDYQVMYKKQNGQCAICEKKEGVLVVDHDHETKKVRGLLCNNCNAAIGFFGDSITKMQNAIRYLE